MSDFLGGAEDWFDDDDDEAEKRRKEREPDVVPFVPIRCPRCKSTRKRTNGQYVEKGRRYHECRDCRHQYYSEEVVIE